MVAFLFTPNISIPTTHNDDGNDPVLSPKDIDDLLHDNYIVDSRKRCIMM